MSVLDEIAIVGIGETPIGKLPGRSAIQLQAEAAVAAVQSAGLSKTDIDAVYSFSGYSQAMLMHGARVAEYLGLRPELAVAVDVGGPGTHHAALMNVAAAIEAGMCTAALCTYGENGISIRKSGRGRAPGTLTGGEDFDAPYGLISMISGYALFAQRHMHEYGTTSEQLGAVAVTSRHHASLNENAHKTEPITLDDHQASPMISSPLRKLDCSLISDAGGAFVVMSKRQARRWACRLSKCWDTERQRRTTSRLKRPTFTSSVDGNPHGWRSSEPASTSPPHQLSTSTMPARSASSQA